MIPGPAPKPDDERINRNPKRDLIELAWDGVRRGPNLPRDVEWPHETQKWWRAWRSSPQAMIMTETDWETLIETALIHKMIYERTRAEIMKPAELTNLLSELRRRVAAFGATIEDRMKLRIAIVDPNGEDKVLEEAAKVVDYVGMFTGDDDEDI